MLHSFSHTRLACNCEVLEAVITRFLLLALPRIEEQTLLDAQGRAFDPGYYSRVKQQKELKIKNK